MARPKSGTKGGEVASEKWKQTMLKKYGKDGLHRKMQEIGARGGRNGRGPDYKGGFAADRERAALAGAKGGRISRRGKNREPLEVRQKREARREANAQVIKEERRKEAKKTGVWKRLKNFIS